MTMTNLLGVLGIASLAGAFLAQSQPSPVPAFEVASIKVSKSADFRQLSMKYLPGGRFVTTDYPLLLIIAEAYSVPFQGARLTGVPDWARANAYDIEAKADPAGLPAGLSPEARKARMRLMLQKLLVDRFHLVMRRENKEMPVYAMVVPKGGLKLQKSTIDPKDCPDDLAATSNTPASNTAPCHALRGGQGRGLHGQAVSMSDLALALENFADRPVVNQTGVEGLYAIDTTPWLPVRATAAPGAKAEDGSDLATMPSLFTVFAGLGIKLESQKAVVEILTVEHIERPTEN
jgi:uncharacterized protein (TIGR03435 family)